MTLTQFLCGLFAHKPFFNTILPSGVWQFSCKRCGYKNSAMWFKSRGELKVKEGAL